MCGPTTMSRCSDHSLEEVSEPDASGRGQDIEDVSVQSQIMLIGNGMHSRGKRIQLQRWKGLGMNDAVDIGLLSGCQGLRWTLAGTHGFFLCLKIDATTA